jgi:hypothetical protein
MKKDVDLLARDPATMRKGYNKWAKVYTKDDRLVLLYKADN